MTINAVCDALIRTNVHHHHHYHRKWNSLQQKVDCYTFQSETCSSTFWQNEKLDAGYQKQIEVEDNRSVQQVKLSYYKMLICIDIIPLLYIHIRLMASEKQHKVFVCMPTCVQCSGTLQKSFCQMMNTSHNNNNYVPFCAIFYMRYCTLILYHIAVAVDSGSLLPNPCCNWFFL